MGRLLIWAGLSEHMGGASHLKQFRLDRNERGKPMLLDEQGREENTVHFNISHQVSMTATCPALPHCTLLACTG